MATKGSIGIAGNGRERDQPNRRAGGDLGGRDGEGLAAQRVEAVGRATDAPPP